VNDGRAEPIDDWFLPNDGRAPLIDDWVSLNDPLGPLIEGQKPLISQAPARKAIQSDSVRKRRRAKRAACRATKHLAPFELTW